MNSQTLTGQWRQIRGKVKEQWSELSGDELDHFEGNLEQLVGLIQEKTGQARETVEHRLDRIIADCERGEATSREAAEAARIYAEQVSEKASQYAQEMSDAIQQTTEQIRESAREQYREAENLVRRRPVQTLAMTFGVGIVAGIVAGLLVRRR